MRVTPTHDPHGGGHPRLVFWRSDVDATLDNQCVFQLLPGASTIGGCPDADLRLEGLHDQHGEVRRDTEDEYVYVHLDPDGTTTVDGAPVDKGSRCMPGTVSSWVTGVCRSLGRSSPITDALTVAAKVEQGPISGRSRHPAAEGPRRAGAATGTGTTQVSISSGHPRPDARTPPSYANG